MTLGGSNSDSGVARDRLRAIVGQIEASDERIASENKHKSEIFKAAKKDGFNVKALRKVIAARRMDDIDRAKLDDDFDLYMLNLGDLAHAHVEIIDEFDAETGEFIEHHPDVPTHGASPAPGGASDTGSSSANDPGEAAAHTIAVHGGPTAGQGSNALPADTESTAARKDVPGAVPDNQDPASSTDKTAGQTSDRQVKAPDSVSTGNAGLAPAGTQAPSVDINSPVVTEALRPTREADVGGDGAASTNVVPMKRQVQVDDPPDPRCLRPEFCKGHSNLALCEKCKIAAGLIPAGAAVPHMGGVA